MFAFDSDGNWEWWNNKKTTIFRIFFLKLFDVVPLDNLEASAIIYMALEVKVFFYESIKCTTA